MAFHPYTREEIGRCASLAKSSMNKTLRLTARLLPLVLPALAAADTARADMLTIERIFAAPDLSGASLRSPQLSPDGRYVAYLRGGERNKDRLDLWAYDIAAKRHTLLVDSARLVP